MSDRRANGPARTPRTSGFVRSGFGGACVRHRKRTPSPMGGARFGMRGGGLGRERQAAGCGAAAPLRFRQKTRGDGLRKSWR